MNRVPRDRFGRSLQFLIDNKISFLRLFKPCPYPGTKYYDDMLRADRIAVHDWGRYDYGSPLSATIRGPTSVAIP